jgi:DNA-binding NtrC family response regulator
MTLQHNANLENNATMNALNILLVDDDRNLAATLSYGLRKAMGNTNSIVFCSSGSEALAMLATQPFNVVVSDFSMPGMSGLELLKKITQDHHETSLVLITAYGTDTLENEVHQLGFGYITKPFEMPLLMKIIHDLIRHKEAKEGKENAPAIPNPEGNGNSSPKEFESRRQT